jgi:hypothetical protein
MGAAAVAAASSSSSSSSSSGAPLGPPRYLRPPRSETDHASAMPDEMLLRVLSFLDLDSSVHATLVSPRWVPLFNEKVGGWVWVGGCLRRPDRKGRKKPIQGSTKTTDRPTD